MTEWPPPSRAQAAFIDELRRLAADPTTPLIAAEDVTATENARRRLASLGGHGAAVVVRLDTSRLPSRSHDGLRVSPAHEDVEVLLTDGFPSVPPFVHVDHRRFAGTAHVLQGSRLCLYLDPDQEWHPRHTAVHVMTRLWNWFEQAVTGRFDERTALYHPVGGVLHRTPGTPTLVVRTALPPGRPFDRMRLLARTPNRLDALPAGGSGNELLVVSPSGPLLTGAGSTLGQLCVELARVGSPDPDAFVTMLAATAARTPDGSHVYFLLAVPAGHRGGSRHLLCGRLPVDTSDALREVVRLRGPLAVGARDAAGEGIEWCRVSEERREMTTRRDSRTPVQSLRGTRAVVLGCGGLGSWIAEFIARAGAARIVLCDPRPVTGGLLVRQDYVETDIGDSKAQALERRLAAIRDDLRTAVLPMPFVTGTPIPNCDLLVDATVSRSVSAALAAAWPRSKRAPLVATVATDRASSTLGLLTVTRPGSRPDPEAADDAARDTVLGRPDLEPFACFWQDPEPGDEVNPAPGCSVPTFHGSAADLAVVAGAMTRLIGGNLAAPDLAGTHLVAMPHAGHSAGHVWLGLADGAASCDAAAPAAGRPRG